jgi:preprotein translocase subunit SecG
VAIFVTVIHIITALLLVGVVLLQSGKGAEISSSFGGSSQTIFGSSGGANFFTRVTSVLAAIFMATSIGLTLFGRQERTSIFESGVQLPKADPVVDTKSSSDPKAPDAASPSKPETQKDPAK